MLTPPTGRYRYIALNTRVKPFDDVNVRKAIVAGFDRNALRQAFGGPLTGDIPTHFIPPGQPGFEEAGGAKGPGVDFLAKPEGDIALAQSYMKKAGFASGKYDGDKTFSAVSDNATQQRKVGEVATQQFGEARVQGRHALRRPRLDVHEVLPGARRAARHLPERRLAEGLRRPRDAARAGVQRQEHPRRGQLELRPARRQGGQRADGQGRGRSTTSTSATRRGPTWTRP